MHGPLDLDFLDSTCTQEAFSQVPISPDVLDQLAELHRLIRTNNTLQLWSLKTGQQDAKEWQHRARHDEELDRVWGRSCTQPHSGCRAVKARLPARGLTAPGPPCTLLTPEASYLDPLGSTSSLPDAHLTTNWSGKAFKRFSITCSVVYSWHYSWFFSLVSTTL